MGLVPSVFIKLVGFVVVDAVRIQKRGYIRVFVVRSMRRIRHSRTSLSSLGDEYCI